MSFGCYHNYNMQARKVKTRTILEARIVRNVVDQKNQLQLRFGLLGGYINYVENVVIVRWSIGIQLT